MWSCWVVGAFRRFLCDLSRFQGVSKGPVKYATFSTLKRRGLEAVGLHDRPLTVKVTSVIGFEDYGWGMF